MFSRFFQTKIYVNCIYLESSSFDSFPDRLMVFCFIVTDYRKEKGSLGS